MKILLVGYSPLPFENSKMRTAYSLRTWHFVKPLLERKSLKLDIISLNEKVSKMREIKHEEYTEYLIPKNKRQAISYLKTLQKRKHYDAVIAVNNYPSYLVSLTTPSCPFWADLNGWIMAEAVAQADINTNNSFLPFLWQREKQILLKADKISTVSVPQKYAILAELSCLGRLHKDTNRYQFLEVIENATEHFPNDEIPKEAKPLFREKIVPNDAFCIAFIGGYNTWVDEETLFKGIEIAMNSKQNIHFVSTGGEIRGLNDKTFHKFQKHIEKSKHKDRYHFLGWIETEDMAKIYSESDCGVNIDYICPETETGARNRLNEMMKMGLPVITTLGSEISYEIQKHQAGIVIKSGNYRSFGESIVKLADNQSLMRELAEKGKKYIKEECNYGKTLQPLIEWLQNGPGKAPGRRINVNKKNWVKAGIQYLKKNGVGKILQKMFR